MYKKRCLDGYCSSEIDLRAISHFFETQIYVFTSRDLKEGKRPKKIHPCDTEIKRKKRPVGRIFSNRALHLHKNENPVFFQPIISFNKHYKFNDTFEKENSDFGNPLKLVIPKKRYLPFSERPLQKQNMALKENTNFNIKHDNKQNQSYSMPKFESIQSIPPFINEDERQKLVNIIWRGEEYFGDLNDKLPLIESDSSVFEIKPFPSDGNDFYKCLSYLITSRDDFHAKIRIALSKFMSESMNEYMLNKICIKTGNQDIKTYLSTRNVQNLGTKAGTVELHAAALMLGLPICVVKGKSAKQLELYLPEEVSENQRGLVLYFGSNHYSPVLKYSKALKHEALNIRSTVLKRQPKKNLHTNQVINDENANPASTKKINLKRKMIDKPSINKELYERKDKIEIPIDDLIKDLIPKEYHNPVEPIQERFMFGKSNSSESTLNQDVQPSGSQLNVLNETQPFEVSMKDKSPIKPYLFDIDDDMLQNPLEEISTSALDNLLDDNQTLPYNSNNIITDFRDILIGESSPLNTPKLSASFDDLIKFDKPFMQNETLPRFNEISVLPSSQQSGQGDNLFFQHDADKKSDNYHYQADASMNCQSYVITVPSDKSFEERIEYAIDIVFKRPSQEESNPTLYGEDNDIIIGRNLSKEDMLKERNFTKLVKMINDVYGSSQLNTDIFDHLKRVIRFTNIADLMNSNISNDVANEHKIRIIDIKKRMHPFQTDFKIKTSDCLLRGKFKYGCVAISQKKEATDNTVAYYHSGGKRAQWIPIPINSAIIKLQDKLHPRKSIVMESEVYILSDNELIIIDLFNDDQKTMTMSVPITKSKDLILARMKHRANICILDVNNRQLCIISKESPLQWTSLNSIDETKMANTRSLQYTLHTSENIPEIVTVPVKGNDSKYTVCDIFTSNQSCIIECNEYSLMQMKKPMTITSIHPGFIQIKIKHFDENDNTKYILVKSEVLNKTIEMYSK